MARACNALGLGMALKSVGKQPEAKFQYESALALWESSRGPNHYGLGTILNNLGTVLQELGQYEEARGVYERALALWEKSLGPEYSLVGQVLNDMAYPHLGLGRILVQRKAWTQAEHHLQQALALLEKGLGKEHPELAEALLELGEFSMARGKPAEAVPQLERALAVVSERNRARLQFALARALWDSHQERKRAYALATQAHGRWQRIGHQPGSTATSQWLAAHPAP